MDDDYVHSASLDSILALLSAVESDSTSDSYHGTLYCDRVSSDVPMLFLAHRGDVGWFVSLHEVTEGVSRNFVASWTDERSSVIELLAGQHRLAIPVGHFLPLAEALKCVRHFGESAAQRPRTKWVAYDQLGYELYAD